MQYTATRGTVEHRWRRREAGRAAREVVALRLIRASGRGRDLWSGEVIGCALALACPRASEAAASVAFHLPCAHMLRTLRPQTARGAALPRRGSAAAAGPADLDSSCTAG